MQQASQRALVLIHVQPLRRSVQREQSDLRFCRPVAVDAQSDGVAVRGQLHEHRPICFGRNSEIFPEGQLHSVLCGMGAFAAEEVQDAGPGQDSYD